MRYRLTVVSLLFLVASVTFVWGQTPASTSGCEKNVSFAVAEDGQPVPAIPKFTLKWLGSKTRREDFGHLCFSQVPAAALMNYVIVFSTNPAAFNGLKASAHTYQTSPETKPGGGAGVSSYGGIWSYAYSGVAPPPTTDTLELKRDDKPKSVEVRAYDQTGRVISQGSLATISSREKLLEKVLSDILKDSPPAENRKLWASQLPVYYVNCDVDAESAAAKLQPVSASVPAAASIPTAPKPAAPAPPPPALDIWSSPAGADIFVDGTYVGRTPYSMNLPPGEHTIDLRKKDFAIWQRKVQVAEGSRRVGGYLEQKVLNLQ